MCEDFLDGTEWGDGLSICKSCGEDIRAPAKICKDCKQQECIDNDEYFDPRRFGFEAGYYSK